MAQVMIDTGGIKGFGDLGGGIAAGGMTRSSAYCYGSYTHPGYKKQ